MIYELTQIVYQMQAPKGRHNSILNRRGNMYIIAKFIAVILSAEHYKLGKQ